jgi:tRNA threonylcarbamoyl adenosine modification protein YeaZ
MLILALDTTSEKGGVGIFDNAECLASVLNQGPANVFSVTLFQMVQQALAQAHLELSQIELYAVANGPGSFTGIRVGLAAARAWGTAFGRPVRGVSTLAALANKPCLTSDWAFPILDARRGEFFLGSFRRIPHEAGSANGPKYEVAGAGWVLKPALLRLFLEERLPRCAGATCVVRAHDLAAQALRDSLPSALAWQQVEGALLDTIASLARKREPGRGPDSDSQLDAYYIRRPDAEINWKD